MASGLSADTRELPSWYFLWEIVRPFRFLKIQDGQSHRMLVSSYKSSSKEILTNPFFHFLNIVIIIQICENEKNLRYGNEGYLHAYDLISST